MNDGFFGYVEAEIERMTKAKDAQPEGGEFLTDMGYDPPSPVREDALALLARMRALPRG